MTPWCPKFVYSSGPAVTLSLTYPFRPPRLPSWSVGAGSEESASGVPAVWPGRRLHSFAARLRFTEAEWANVRSFLEWAVGGSSFTFYPDAAVAGTSHTVYLVAPTVTDRIAPELGADHMLELDVEVRRTDNAAIDLTYYAAS